MIFSVTPNAAIDRTLVIPGFQAEGVFRAVQETVTAGGKGLNMARAVRFLGEPVTCLGFLGGHTGRYFAALTEAEGFQAHWTWVTSGETRTCTIVLDGQGGEPTVLNTVGPTLDAGDWEHLANDLLGLVQPGDAVSFSGSLPPGSPVLAYAGLIRRLGEHGCRVWVDTSKAALQAALEAGPHGIKVNAEEMAAALGMAVGSPIQAAQAARAACGRGVGMTVVTLGKDGAVLATPGGAWHASGPEIAAVSNVGSGDAFFAGLVSALQIAQPPQEALRRATAAGAANALSALPGTLQRDDYTKCLAQTQVTRL